MQTTVATQQINSALSILEARYLRDYRRYDPRIFSETLKDPTIAQL